MRRRKSEKELPWSEGEGEAQRRGESLRERRGLQCE